MKYIELIKLVFGTILLLIVTIIATVFLFENLGILDRFFEKRISRVFYGDSKQVFVFLGFCSISGAYLLSNVKSINNKPQKNEN